MKRTVRAVDPAPAAPPPQASGPPIMPIGIGIGIMGIGGGGFGGGRGMGGGGYGGGRGMGGGPASGGVPATDADRLVSALTRATILRPPERPAASCGRSVAIGHDFRRLLQHAALDAAEMREALVDHVSVERLAPGFERGAPRIIARHECIDRSRSAETLELDVVHADQDAARDRLRGRRLGSRRQ